MMVFSKYLPSQPIIYITSSCCETVVNLNYTLTEVLQLDWFSSGSEILKQISILEGWRFRYLPCQTLFLTLHVLKHLIDTLYILFSLPPPAGPLFRSPCELLPVGTGHPVQAMLKSYTVMSGCASRGTASLPQEVHVINLRGHAPQSPDSNPAKVSHCYWK